MSLISGFGNDTISAESAPIWKCANHDQSCTDAEIARSELLISVFSAKELFHPFKNGLNFHLRVTSLNVDICFLMNVQPKKYNFIGINIVNL